MLEPFQPLIAIATTPATLRLLYPLLDAGAALWIPESLSQQQVDYPKAKIYRGSLRSHLTQLWPTGRSFVFGLATGATTRLVAPLLQDKSADPAVVVVDDAGQFVISLCGGHQGGADQLARLLAIQLGSQAVLTGAANHQNQLGIDLLGQPFGWQRGEGNWTGVSAALARRATVEVIQEVGSELWQMHLPSDHSFHFGFWPDDAHPSADAHESADAPESNSGPTSKPEARVWISTATRTFSSEGTPKVQWHPRVLWVGIGCERGSSRRLIETAIAKTFQAAHLAEGAIAGIASLNLKADEAGLIELCQARDWPLRCFPAETLSNIAVPTPSEIVNAEVGTPSVAEAAAIAAARARAALDPAHTQTPEETVDPKTINRPERSPGRLPDSLIVKKQIHRLEGEPGAVTVAVAEAALEWTGRTGHLSLVGTGPGALEQMTPAAKGAIAAADAVIGYGLYIDLIRPLLRPGQLVEALPITQERQRAERAIALAHWGLSVAVISSGDSGIYGMAGLVLEQLSRTAWDGRSPGVQVFPGITALQAAAARVGTPLMHDFCAISLSDLLTPWTVIEKRLQAAAQADFVVALYNPKSKTRTQQINQAQAILLQHRPPKTPVALVRSAYREQETIELITLGQLSDATIDMLTTVLIGNASTLRHHDWLITPRGYLGKQ